MGNGGGSGRALRAMLAVLALPMAVSAASAVLPEARRWWSHVTYLADDRLEGRETGSAGHQTAARYVESRLRESGAEPAGGDGYFQHVRFHARRIREEESRLALVREGRDETLTPG